MALPGLLPGLDFLSAPQSTPQQQQQPSAISPPREITLSAGSEWRFELSTPSSAPVTVELLHSSSSEPDALATAELFGTELAPGHSYTFPPLTRAAISTHTGCTLRATGTCDSEYVAEETPLTKHANLHFALEGLRAKGKPGPRVLLVGPPNSGKTALAKLLTAYAQRAGRSPAVVNLAPTEGMLCPAGSFSAAVYGSGAVLEPELLGGPGGWGGSATDGAGTGTVRIPVVYHYGFEKIENENEVEVFRRVSRRVALATLARMDGDPGVGETGMIIDLAGSLFAGSGGRGLDMVEHVRSEFGVDVIGVLGSERVWSDVSRRYPTGGSVTVLKLSKSGGVVERDANYMRTLQAAQVKRYFFGDARMTLSPQSQTLDFDAFTVLRLVDGSSNASFSVNSAFLPGGDPLESATAGGRSDIFVSVTPSLGMEGALLAVKYASPSDAHDVIRDSSVLGFLFVTDVDDAKRKIKVLCPTGGRVPQGRAIVWGPCPEVPRDAVAG